VEKYFESGMELKKQIFWFVVIMVISLPFRELFSQNPVTRPTRQSSLEAFSNGNFEQAYNEFSKLLLTYSKDPLYKYYSGVCLVKLKRNPGEAINFLQQALHGSPVVKTLPSDALFYLGRAQQMSGRFIEAITSYNLNIRQVGRKTARQLGIPEFIQQCREKKGALSDDDIQEDEIVLVENDLVKNVENNQVVNDTLQQPVKNELSDEIVLPASYENILDEALIYQFQADSVNSLVNDLKRELDSIPSGETSAIKSKIAANELLAASFQNSADKKFSEAQVAMNPLEDKNQEIDTLQKTEDKVVKDTVQQSKSSVIKLPEEQIDNIKKVVQAQNRHVEALSFFKILDKPVTDPGKKILIDAEVPEGLIYRIQVAVFRNPVAPEYFKGITPIYGFKVTGTDKKSYFAGMFRRYEDGAKALPSVKARGFKDAFIVALIGKRRISTDRATILEKEWGQIPFKDMNISTDDMPIDTVPPTLSFRVEIIRSEDPLEEDIVAEIKKISGSRGLTIQPIDDGTIAYLVGKFITFESATEYSDLLVRNGYREARVVAWLGKKEIPVETAKQLFDFLE